MSTQTQPAEPTQQSDMALATSLVAGKVSEFLGSKDARLKIPTKAIKTLERILNEYPKLFSLVDERIKVILSDSVLDMTDIPQFILMATDIINADIDLKKIKFTKAEAFDFIESIFIILIESDVLKGGEKKEEYKALLRLMMQVLESSVELADAVDFSKCWCC